MKILFTSVGRRVELMQVFHNAAKKLNIELQIYGADITESAPALFFCDEKLIVPRINDSQYLPVLLSICKNNQIDALIPTIDTDLLLLANHTDDFEKVGTKVFISNPDSVLLCRDKNFTSDFFVECGLSAPKTCNNYKQYAGSFPCFIKPKDGSSSIDAYIINNHEELIEFAHRVSDYVIQPFIDGEEYTVDIFCDFDSQPIFITPRKRLAVRAGEVLKSQITNDETIINECKQIIDKFKPIGAITVQLIKDKTTNINQYIEINPRFGGGAPLSIMAGADSAEATLRILNGESMSFFYCAADVGAVYSRYDQSVRVK